MSLELLLDQFDHVVQTAADVEKLNQSILRLAMQGRLIPRTTNVESASILVERIVANRQLEKNNGQASRKRVATTLKQIPFEIPSNWTWTRLGNVLDFQYGSALPKKNRDDSGEIPVYGSNGIVGQHTQSLVELPCIVIGRKGSAGAVNLVLEPCWVIDTAYYVIPPPELDLIYVYYLLSSLGLDNLGKGIKPGLNRNEAYELPVAIPPLTEQKLIVTKVDELFAQTQQLAQRLQSADHRRRRFHTAALHQLTTAPTPAAATAAWDYLAPHFHQLYTDPDAITELKQAILQLAVSGRLVPQDPNDEPAAVLLQRIAAEKAELVKKGIIRKQKKLTPPSEEEIPYSLPVGWRWAHVETVSKYVIDCPHSTPKFIDDGNYYCIDTTNINQGEIIYEKLRRVSHKTFVERIRRLKPEPGDVLFSREGTIGLSVIVPEGIEICLGQRMMLFRTHEWVIPEYFKLALISPAFVAQWEASLKGTAARHVNIGALKKMLVPIPPLNEQRKIVSKTHGLFELCDQLSKNGRTAETARQRLLNALLTP